MALKKQEPLLTETISSIECYPFDKTTNYIAYGGDLTVGILNYEIKKTEKELRLKGHPNITSKLKSKVLEVSTEGSRVNAIAFAPLAETKGQLMFCTVGNDKAIRVYESDLQKTKKVLQKRKIHTAPVNACTFVTNPELQIATASDDHTCSVISMKTKKVIHSFRFDSNVVAVHSNTQHNQEVMVAEENGFIHIYDLKSGQDILSCRTEIQNGRPTSPLLDAHWHPADFTKVGAVAGNKYFVWDLRNPRQVAERNVAHFSGATRFRWAPQGSLFATCGQFDTVKIWDSTRGLSQTYKQQFRIGGLSWTNTQPSCCVTGSDRKIHFWAGL